MFSASPSKTMQNHIEISSKSNFRSEACEIGPKVVIWTSPDLPRPVLYGPTQIGPQGRRRSGLPPRGDEPVTPLLMLLLPG